MRLPALAASCSVSRSLLSNSKRSKSKWTLYCIMVPGLFVPKTFRSQERIVHMGNFHSRDFSFPGNVPGNFRSRGTKVPGNFRSLDLSFQGTFITRTFCSQELSFLRLFCKALAMNADSYSNCQNLFRSRPSSVCFPKIN